MFFVKILTIITITIAILITVYLRANTLDKSSTISEFYKNNMDASTDVALWANGGAYFRWQSELLENKALPELNVFYRTFGNIENPAIVMIHGWPTSSYDFKDLIQELEKEYYIAVIDTPGYGFSDKPKGAYRYSILDDARLVDYFIRDVLNLRKFTLLTHDKGDSVGFAFLDLYQQAEAASYEIEHHFILNGGIYLPLAELSAAQKYLPIPGFGWFMTRFVLTPDRATSKLAEYYSPALTQAEQLDMASIFKYQAGNMVFPKTLEYLEDRKNYETSWLETLKKSDISATMIWGEQDPIGKTEIADFVWETYLRNRDADASYWRLPCAGHYPQNDQPEIIAQLIRLSLSDGAVTLADSQTPECAAVLFETTQVGK